MCDCPLEPLSVDLDSLTNEIKCTGPRTYAIWVSHVQINIGLHEISFDRRRGITLIITHLCVKCIYLLCRWLHMEDRRDWTWWGQKLTRSLKLTYTVSVVMLNMRPVASCASLSLNESSFVRSRCQYRNITRSSWIRSLWITIHISKTVRIESFKV